ncbi:isoamyl acetate-hydrolyzing esterase 1 homolog isoform X4 [Pan troglodytes]
MAGKRKAAGCARTERAAASPCHSQNHEVLPGFPQCLRPLGCYRPSRVTLGAGGRAGIPRPLPGGPGAALRPTEGQLCFPPRVLRSHSCPLPNAPAPAERGVGLEGPPTAFLPGTTQRDAGSGLPGGSLAVGEQARRPSFLQTDSKGQRPSRVTKVTAWVPTSPAPATHGRPLRRRLSWLAAPPRPDWLLHGAVRGRGLRERPALASLVALRGLHHPGYNTRWAKIILPRLIRKGNSLDIPVAVTIFFGANDSALKDENPKQHIPLEEYAANLKSMVQYLKSVDIPENRVILITPTPLCETAWEEQCIIQGCKLNRLNSVVGEYANACLQVAQDCGTDVLDLWTLMQDSQDFSSYLSDGLHLSPKGNEFLFSHLWPLIEKKVSSLPLLLPYWRDVAEAKPELSLLGDGDH